MAAPAPALGARSAFDWTFVRDLLQTGEDDTETILATLQSCASKIQQRWPAATSLFHNLISPATLARTTTANPTGVRPSFDWNYYRSTQRWREALPQLIPFFTDSSIVKVPIPLWGSQMVYADAIGAIGFLLSHAHPPDSLAASNALLLATAHCLKRLYPLGGRPHVFAMPFMDEALFIQRALIPIDVTIPPSPNKDKPPIAPNDPDRLVHVQSAKEANHHTRMDLLKSLVPASDVEELKRWTKRGYEEEWCCGERASDSGPDELWCAETKIGLFMVLLAKKASPHVRQAFHGKTIVINCLGEAGLDAALESLAASTQNLDPDAIAALFGAAIRDSFEGLFIPVCFRCKLFISYAHSLLVKQHCILKFKIYDRMDDGTIREVDWVPWTLHQMRGPWKPDDIARRAQPASAQRAAPAKGHVAQGNPWTRLR